MTQGHPVPQKEQAAAEVAESTLAVPHRRRHSKEQSGTLTCHQVQRHAEHTEVLVDYSLGLTHGGPSGTRSPTQQDGVNLTQG